jgi:hypothetical protein
MYGRVGTPRMASGIPAHCTFTTYDTRLSHPIIVANVTQLQLQHFQLLQLFAGFAFAVFAALLAQHCLHASHLPQNCQFAIAATCANLSVQRIQHFGQFSDSHILILIILIRFLIAAP